MKANKIASIAAELIREDGRILYDSICLLAVWFYGLDEKI